MDDNPWLTSQTSESSAEPEVREPEPRRWAPGAVVEPVDGLPVAPVAQEHEVGLWVVGAHGGAGTSTVAWLLGAGDAGRCWPAGQSAGARAVVAARTNGHGVSQAQQAAMQWAAGAVPGVDLVGVVWVADAPGRLPRRLSQQLRLVSGAFPLAVRVPWVPDWRTQDPLSSPAPSRVMKVLSVLNERG